MNGFGICLNGSGYLFGKNCHLFEWLGLSVWEKLSSIRTAWDICLKKLSSFEWLGLSVRKRICRPFERLKLSVQRQILAEFPSQNHFIASQTRFERSVILQVTYVTKFEVCLQKHHLWIVTDLCSFVVIFTFMFIYQSIIDSIDLLFIQYLSFFFSTSFPKIIFFIFYGFVVYEPAEWNFIFLACREHKTRKIFFFNWLHFFFSWLFLYHKEVTQVFSSMLNFAWQFSYQWNQRSAILPQTQIGKFGRLKFDTHTVLSREEVLISLIILLQVLLSSWRSARKVQLCFLRKLAEL